MKYRSTHSHLPLNFVLGSTPYCVEPGAEVTIDDKWHSRIVDRGLMLEVVVAKPIKAVEPEVEEPVVVEFVEPEPSKVEVAPTRRGPGRPPNSR